MKNFIKWIIKKLHIHIYNRNKIYMNGDDFNRYLTTKCRCGKNKNYKITK